MVKVLCLTCKFGIWNNSLGWALCQKLTASSTAKPELYYLMSSPRKTGFDNLLTPSQALIFFCSDNRISTD